MIVPPRGRAIVTEWALFGARVIVRFPTGAQREVVSWILESERVELFGLAAAIGQMSAFDVDPSHLVGAVRA